MSPRAFTVGCVQLNPTDDRPANIEQAAQAIAQAAARGASLVALPEYVSLLHAGGSVMRSHGRTEDTDPALARFRELAALHGIWISVGSLAIAGPHDKLINRSFLITPGGDIAARYDKLHMFDATLPGGRVIRESSSYVPGVRAVVADTPWARLGLSICYDLRFAALYRALAQAGAEILMVPSAFTQATGVLHWKPLLQARAIENRAYVVAAATCGRHPGGHETHGHAMVIDPDGQVLAEAAGTPEVLCVTIDPDAVTLARTRIPSLSHDRDFDIEQPAAQETA